MKTKIETINDREIHIISDSLYGAIKGQRVTTTTKGGKVWALLGDYRVAGEHGYYWIPTPVVGAILGTFGNSNNPDRVKIVSIGRAQKVTEAVGVVDEDHSYSGFRKTGEDIISIQEVVLEVI